MTVTRRLQRCFQITMVCVVGCLGFACKSPHDSALQEAAVRESLELILEDASDDGIGTLRLVDTDSGVRWTMTDSARREKSYGELCSGEVSGMFVRDFADDFGDAWIADGSPAGARVRGTLRRFRGDELVSERIVVTEDRKVLSDAIPTSPRFTTLWREATGIAKVFWYRDLGPIDWTGRAVMTMKVPDPPAQPSPSDVNDSKKPDTGD